MEVIAKSKNVRRAPRKARVVGDAIKGLSVNEALTQLSFMPQHAAKDVAKVVRQASANAQHNFNLTLEDLYVTRLLVDEGPKTLKRMRPVSRGMGHPYIHRYCHITAVVEDNKPGSGKK